MHLIQPISLISITTKTVEKSFLLYITANIPNTPRQQGYKTQQSTVKALQTLNNTVENRFNQMAPPCTNNQCNTRYEQHFRHNKHTRLLIRKLLQTKIPGTIIKFITNYIKGSKAYTTYRTHITSERQFKNGVSQGGVLSPTLINIYTADIPPPSTSSGHVLRI